MINVRLSQGRASEIRAYYGVTKLHVFIWLREKLEAVVGKMEHDVGKIGNVMNKSC